jgi:catechol 2,3-dioxygenase-like lactoylglutathione lyase family enzyme
MSTDTDDQTPERAVSVDVASCVVRVSDLDRSLKFYCDVLSCRLAIREADVALLLTPKGFQIYPTKGTSYAVAVRVSAASIT